MDLEVIWYECSPYVYLAGGVLCLAKATSSISVISGILLIGAAGTIIRMRWLNRRTPKGKVRWPTRKTPHGTNKPSKIRKH